MRRDHVAEIRRRYGYRDFHEGSEVAALSRWLANRAWVGAERPSVLFDLATARLVGRKVLLPGVTRSPDWWPRSATRRPRDCGALWPGP